MRDRVEWVVARTAFPVSLTLALGTAVWLMNDGVPADTVTLPIILTANLSIAILERLVPLHQKWLRNHGDVGPDVGLALTNVVVNGVGQAVIVGAMVVAAGWLATHFGANIWPTGWPLLAQLVPALILAELVEYSAHRAMHEIPWLWPIHAPHHSCERLYWLNAARFHPLDVLLVGPGKLAPLVLLGADERIFALVGIFAAVHGIHQHGNVPCRLGPLNWVFSMAELHRWHHSPIPEESNHNYGGNLIFWDIVFGTRWLPEDREPPVDIGIQDLPNFPRDYWSLVTAPFRWKSLVERARAGSDVGSRSLHR